LAKFGRDLAAGRAVGSVLEREWRKYNRAVPHQAYPRQRRSESAGQYYLQDDPPNKIGGTGPVLSSRWEFARKLPSYLAINYNSQVIDMQDSTCLDRMLSSL